MGWLAGEQPCADALLGKDLDGGLWAPHQRDILFVLYPQTDGSPESRPPNVNRYKMKCSPLEGETLAILFIRQ
jgi:hypothetical protein